MDFAKIALSKKVMPSFTLRSARAYMKYCSYSTRIRMMTRKRPPLTALSLIVMAMLTTVVICRSELVSVYVWLKNGFVTHEVKTAAACTPC